jgi:hypothetical protein
MAAFVSVSPPRITVTVTATKVSYSLLLEQDLYSNHPEYPPLDIRDFLLLGRQRRIEVAAK